MSSLSIRKLPPDLERALEHAARARRATKTAVVVSALRDALLPDQTAQQRRLLRFKRFFGKLTPEDYRALEQNTAVFEQVEDELWR